MLNTILNTVITFIVSGALGFSVSKIQGYKKKLKEKDEEGKLLKTALMTMLQSNLTNTYYVYEPQKAITDYMYRNWLNSFKIYKQLGGNDYCDTLKGKMENWEIIRTDILK